MYWKNVNTGGFCVLSRSNNKTIYNVNKTMDKCDCPKFIFILKSQGQCHHIEEVVNGEGLKTLDLKGFKKFNQDEYIEPLSDLEFAEVYGDEQMDKLLASHEIIIHSQKVRLLK